VSLSGNHDDGNGSLANARGGSLEALGAALETHRRYLLLVAEKELAPDLRAKGGASDLVQETFLEAQRDLAQFRGRSDNEFRGWLRRILLHNLGVFTRRYRETGIRNVGREVGLSAGSSSGGHCFDPAAASATPSGLAMAEERTLALQEALDRLPDDYHRVIHLRYDDDLTFEQIGQVMGRSPEAARKLWARAMDCLRAEFRSAR
jgi:RNA polymerase sigma-70 factor, ECF subfamily